MVDDDARRGEHERVDVRRRREARVAQGIATHRQSKAVAQGLLEMLRRQPVGAPLSDEAQAMVGEVAPALRGLIAEQLAIYDDDTPGFYDLASQLAEIAPEENHGAEQMTALAIEVTGWAASLAALAAQVRLLHELRRRGLL